MKIWFYVVVHAFACVIFPLSGDENRGCEDTGSSIEWKSTPKKWPFKRYLGEWWIADCQVKNRDVNVTLWEERNGGSYRKVIVEDNHLKRIKNTFNFTNVSGVTANRKYYCMACGKKIYAGKFTIEKNGKAFQYPKILNKPSGPIELGSDVVLTCQVYGLRYELRWYKDGDDKELETGRKRLSNTGKLQRILTIKNYNKSNDGVYRCCAEREIVKWSAEDEVHLLMRKFVKPTFGNISDGEISFKEGDTLYLEFQASGYPKPEVNCKQGQEREQYFKKNGSLVILQIRDLRFSRHNGASFQCDATNAEGLTTWSISLNIWVKPKLNIHEHARIKLVPMDTKPPVLLCQVNEANPLPTVEWSYSDDNEQTWSPITPNVGFGYINGSTLSLNEQNVFAMFYKCVAKNRLGEDFFTWNVLNEALRNGVVGAYAESKQSTFYVTAIVITSCITGVFILCFVVIMYRRKKALGGFYLCTLPPNKDYISILDESKFIHEQTHKLPYMSEWEFPRENVLFRGELGSGAFGVVYLAQAVGMSDFLTRRSALKDTKPQRRFSLARLKKRSPALSNNDCDVKTAVKTLKDDHCQNDLSDILSELKVLIHVGEHENVLRILGACTKVAHNEAPLIILEYCPHGNLREFLRTRRDVYEPIWKDVDNVGLSISDVAKFALHVAKGMEFLVSRKVK